MTAEAVEQTAPTAAVVKRLFAVSGNRCAFPRCRTPIILEGSVVGEVAHIHAAKLGGPRFLASQTPADRHGFANLLLLCGVHHKVVDDDEVSYTAERLREIKAVHEDHASPLRPDEELRGELLLIQAVNSSGQSGGIAANVVNAGAIHIHAGQRSETIERSRQDAIGSMWKAIIKLREEFGPVTLADSVLTSGELQNCFAGSGSNTIFEALLPFASQNVVFEKMERSGSNETEAHRPFASPRLYHLFSVARAVLARSALLIQLSFKYKKYRDWRDDELIADQLRSVFPPATVEGFLSMKNLGLITAIDAVCSEYLKESQK